MHGIGPDGSDALTTDWSSALGFKNPFLPLAQIPIPTKGKDDGLEEPGQLATRPLLPRRPSLMACLAAPGACF